LWNDLEHFLAKMDGAGRGQLVLTLFHHPRTQ
jgi:hypothetical protein